MQVIRDTMLESCKAQGVLRRGHGEQPKYNGGDTGVDVAANMKRDGWVWHMPQPDFVRNTGLRRAEIIMLNAFRRLLSAVASLNGDLSQWSGSSGMPTLHPTPRIHAFHHRAATGPPTGLLNFGDPASPPQADLYASPSMNGPRRGQSALHSRHNELGRGPSPVQYGAAMDNCGLPLPPQAYYNQSGRSPDRRSRTGGRHAHHRSEGAALAASPRSNAPGTEYDGPQSGIPFGVNFAQLNKEVRHLYSFAVIETARRVGDTVVQDAGGMQRIIDSVSETVPQVFRAPYSVGPAAGDARVLCAQRLHDNMQQLLQGMRRALEDKAFVALARGVWDHIGARAYNCLQNLANGSENPVCIPLSALRLCKHALF